MKPVPDCPHDPSLFVKCQHSTVLICLECFSLRIKKEILEALSSAKPCVAVEEQQAQSKPEPQKFDPTKPVQTRRGGEARIVCTNAKNRHPIIALVKSCGYEYAEHYGLDGSAQRDDGDSDLVNIEEPTPSVEVQHAPESQKPFDYTKPCRTVSGRRVAFVRESPALDPYPLIFTIEEYFCGKTISRFASYTRDGLFMLSNPNDALNLVNIPEE